MVSTGKKIKRSLIRLLPGALYGRQGIPGVVRQTRRGEARLGVVGLAQADLVKQVKRSLIRLLPSALYGRQGIHGVVRQTRRGEAC